MIQAVVVLVTLIAIYIQIRLARYANMLPLFTSLEARWWSPRLVRARHNACTRHLDSQYEPAPGLAADEDAILAFFEDVGLYVAHGVLAKSIVWEKLSLIIEQYWQMLAPRIDFERRVDPTYFTHFERLRRTMLRISKRRGASITRVVGSQLFTMIHEELERLTLAAQPSNTPES